MRTRVLRVLDVGGLPRTFWWLWAGTLVNRTGGFVTPFMAYYLTAELGHSAAFAGFIAGLTAAGAVISAVVGGVLADRIGRRPTLLASQGAFAVALVALGFARSVPAIVVLAFFVGLANNAYRPAMAALIADVVGPEDRARAYSLNYWAINLGFAVAMVSAGLLAAQSYLLLFLGDAGTSVAFALLIFFKVPEARRPAARTVSGIEGPRGGGLGTVLRDKPFMAMILVITLVGSIYVQCNSSQPIAMARDGLGPTAFGLVCALNGVLIGVLQLPLTSWLRRYPNRSVMACASLLIGLGFAVPLLIGPLGHPMAVYALAVTVWTVGEIGNAPTSAAMVANMAPSHLRGRYQGMFTLAWSVAGVAGPLTGGIVLASLGASALWWGCLGAGVVGAVAWLAVGRAVADRTAVVMAGECAVAEPVLVSASSGASVASAAADA